MTTTTNGVPDAKNSFLITCYPEALLLPFYQVNYVK